MASFGRSEGEGTVIGTHVSLSGVLADSQDIVIFGKVEGEVRSDHAVSVGEHAVIKGPVAAKRVAVAGTVRGNIHAAERLEILPKGNVAGNIETRDLVIHSGATFNGRCQIIGGEAKESEGEKQRVQGDVREEEATQPQPAAEPEKPRRIWPPIRLARRERASIAEPPQEKTSEPEPAKEQEKPTYEIE